MAKGQRVDHNLCHYQLSQSWPGFTSEIFGVIMYFEIWKYHSWLKPYKFYITTLPCIWNLRFAACSKHVVAFHKFLHKAFRIEDTINHGIFNSAKQQKVWHRFSIFTPVSFLDNFMHASFHWPQITIFAENWQLALSVSVPLKARSLRSHPMKTRKIKAGKEYDCKYLLSMKHSEALPNFFSLCQFPLETLITNVIDWSWCGCPLDQKNLSSQCFSPTYFSSQWKTYNVDSSLLDVTTRYILTNQEYANLVLLSSIMRKAPPDGFLSKKFW